MKRLLLDLGNTRMKWCIASSVDDVRCQGSVPYDELTENLERFRESAVYDGGVWFGNVGNNQFAERIMQIFPDAHCLSSPIQRAGVTNSYFVPSKLGVDRWFGLVADLLKREYFT